MVAKKSRARALGPQLCVDAFSHEGLRSREFHSYLPLIVTYARKPFPLLYLQQRNANSCACPTSLDSFQHKSFTLVPSIQALCNMLSSFKGIDDTTFTSPHPGDSMPFQVIILFVRARSSWDLLNFIFAHTYSPPSKFLILRRQMFWNSTNLTTPTSWVHLFLLLILVTHW